LLLTAYSNSKYRVPITNNHFFPFDYIENRPNMKQLYDLILVDCYIGRQEPKSTKTIKFLVHLKQLGKHVLFNQLFIPHNPQEMEKIAFLKQLDRYYPVKALKLSYNIIIEF